MTDKTIKELADMLDISKDKARYRVSKLPRDFTYQKNGITYIKNRGLKEIMLDLGVDNDVPNHATSHTSTSEEKQLLFLQNELSEKNRQLSKKDDQIETMQKLLDQQQQLTLQSNKRLEQLETQLQLETKKSEEEFLSSETEDRTDPTPTPDKKWWHFLR